MPQFELVLHPDYLIPIMPRRQILTAHSVAIKGGVIDSLLPRDQARQLNAEKHVELDGHALLPGFINMHCHAAMALLRGYADDLPLMTWLQDYIWPTESAFISADFVRDGTDLALADLIMGGTTTFSDHYFFPEIAAECADRAGIRALLTFPVIDVKTAWASNSEACINRGLALRDGYRDHPLIDVGFGPHSTYMVSEATLARIAMLADELEAPVQIHLHETRDEVLSAVERTGERPIDYLERIGLLGPRTHCVHMTALGQQDIDAVALHRAHVVHCPRSNLKVGTQICPAQQLLNRGVNVALGTDGAASGNRLSMMAEIQMASMLGKTQEADPRAVSAWTTLEMATLHGARALGQESHLGSIEAGKSADLIALDLSGIQHQPMHDPVSSIVYAASGQEVTWSWVAGKPLLSNGQLQTLEQTDVMARAQRWSDQLTAFRSTLER